MILVVDDAQIDAGYRAAGRSQKTCTVVLVLEDRHNGGAFGLAVGLCEARVWQSRQRPEKRRLADRRSAICYIPNLRDRSARAFRFIDQHLDHRRNRERGGHGLFLDKLRSEERRGGQEWVSPCRYRGG